MSLRSELIRTQELLPTVEQIEVQPWVNYLAKEYQSNEEKKFYLWTNKALK